MWLFSDPMNCNPPGSSVHGIPRQEYWSGLTFPSPGDLPDPGIEPPEYVSSKYVFCVAGGFFTTEPPREPIYLHYHLENALRQGEKSQNV